MRSPTHFPTITLANSSCSDKMQGLLKQQSRLLTLLLALCWASYVAADTQICLNMIAKNEADGLLECLEPLSGELAGWTLCDTGKAGSGHTLLLC